MSNDQTLTVFLMLETQSTNPVAADLPKQSVVQLPILENSELIDSLCCQNCAVLIEMTISGI
jgi:hypothetical protein